MEIKKTTIFLWTLIIILCISGCGSEKVISYSQSKGESNGQIAINEKKPAFVEKMDLQYATEFSVDLYENGYASIHVTDGNSYVLVPEGYPRIYLDDENATFITQPCNSIYLAASSAMDLFNVFDDTDKIKACSTKASDYADENIKKKIETGEINYVGKYSAPDYEKLIDLNTDLAIESTMIYHSPKIKEELENLGIPVFVERSSYEKEPLGRFEWVKLYGVLLGKSDEAGQIFDEQIKSVNSVIERLSNSTFGASNQEIEKPKVVFFYLSSNGYVNVRKPGDYVSKMIEIAGGEYAFESLKIKDENALSTVNISWEDFYVYAKDADVLIYNGTIDGGIVYKEDLIKQNEMFADFKSVKENRVYCSNNNMYQETSKMGDIISELFVAIHPEMVYYDDGDGSKSLTYLRAVK